MGVINLGILVKKIMSKLSGAGFIKDTDYASSSKGGTIKIDTTYATDITSGGKLKAKEITAEAYSEANGAAFISKATLDNVLAAQPAPAGFSPAYITATDDGMISSRSITLPKAATEYSILQFQLRQRGDTVWYNQTILCPESTSYNLKGSTDIPNVSINISGTGVTFSGSNANGVIRVYGA